MPTNRLTIIPAAGLATRMGGIPKFLLPLYHKNNEVGAFRTLLEFHISLSLNFGNRTVITTRPENALLLSKYIVPGVVELMCMETETMSETILRTTKYCPADEYLMVMPDTFYSKDFSVSEMELKDNEICALALWNVTSDQKGAVGQIGIDSEGKIISHEDKSLKSNLPFVWGAMSFSQSFLTHLTPEMQHIGYGISHFLEKRVQGSSFIGSRLQPGEYIDCGTHEGFKNYMSSSFV
jgi:hypothetical protein